MFTKANLVATVAKARYTNKVSVSLRNQGFDTHATQARVNALGYLASARNIKVTLMAREMHASLLTNCYSLF